MASQVNLYSPCIKMWQCLFLCAELHLTGDSVIGEFTEDNKIKTGTVVPRLS